MMFLISTIAIIEYSVNIGYKQILLTISIVNGA